MKLAIITHVEHIKKEKQYWAYSPYVKEMNVWGKHASELIIVGPVADTAVSPIHSEYRHPKITLLKTGSFSLISFANTIKAMRVIPQNVRRIYQAMKQADHIHLRCPGNMGLLGCLVQVGFPAKPKTAKYAGNWDPKSPQPWSYRLQKWILSNTFLTRNMQVLVYGQWENQTKNIKPFFTASYRERDKKEIVPRTLSGMVSFLFVGTLSKGKQPLYAIRLVEQLHEAGYTIRLDLYGEGAERKTLETYIAKKGLGALIRLQGNQTGETLQTAYQNSHFLVLPSQSEGWPKAVAEAMFWGCLPLATKVSCIPDMLDFGNRGVLLSENIAQDSKNVADLLLDQQGYEAKIKQATEWSRKYTLDTFENEIKLVLHP